MNKPIKIRKIWGQQVEFHPFTNMFYVKLGGVEFRDPQLDHLIKKIEISNIILLDKEVYFKTTLGYEKKKIVRLEHFGEYFYDEDGRQQMLSECFPITEGNKKIMDEAEKIKEEGWALIHKADELKDEKLEKFPKNHWEKVLKEKIKEYKTIDKEK